MRLLSLLVLIAASFEIRQDRLDHAQVASKVSSCVVLMKGVTAGGTSLGSGFILSSDGKIASNLHVIQDWKSGAVQLQNGEIFEVVSVIAVDARKDLAIVQVAGFDLPTCRLGNSTDVKVGESVVAIGSPRGLRGSVTAGIVSAIRDDVDGGGLKLIQTDAAANPGNSGGPLVNDKGLVIGIISSKLRESEGLNFAIPINYLRGMLSALNQPMTFEAMREKVRSGVDVFKATTYPERWKSLSTGVRRTLRFNGDYIYGEGVISAEERQRRDFVVLELKKKGAIFVGVQRYGFVCEWDSSWNRKRNQQSCVQEWQMELTTVTADRIEGRSYGPPRDAKFDCKKCASSKASEWSKFTWIPE